MCLSQIKQNIKKQKYFVRDKDKSVQLLCIMNPSFCWRILGNFLTGEEMKFVLKIPKRHFKFLGLIIRKEDMKNLTLAGYNKCKRGTGKQRVIYITGLCKGSGDSKRENIAESYKGWDVVEIHEQPRPAVTLFTKEEDEEVKQAD